MRFSSPLGVMVGLALACAGPRPTPPPPPAAIAHPPAPGPDVAAPRVTRGMEAAQVRRALGEPKHVEKVGSVAAPGAAYDRWIYADREVVLLDGKVVDVVP
jgi:hypothetical protein